MCHQHLVWSLQIQQTTDGTQSCSGLCLICTHNHEYHHPFIIHRKGGSGTMLGNLLGSPVIGPCLPVQLRLISQGQEITPDLDERSLAELGFKDFSMGQKI